MSITRYILDFDCITRSEEGPYVAYEDHAELMADLQRQLDETEALLAEAAVSQDAMERRINELEEEISDLQSSLYTYTESDQ